MRPIAVIAAAFIFFVSCAEHEGNKPVKIDRAYLKNLQSLRKNYPFDRWKTYYGNGLKQYTAENCERAKRIMDKLIEDLAAAGVHAPEKEKVKCFKIAVEAYNALNAKTNLIETGEREELFSLFELAAKIAGIDTSRYGSGEGIASEWREW